MKWTSPDRCGQYCWCWCSAAAALRMRSRHGLISGLHPPTTSPSMARTCPCCSTIRVRGHTAQAISRCSRFRSEDLLQAPSAEVRRQLAWIHAKGMKLAVQLPALPVDKHVCGNGIEGMTWPGEAALSAKALQALGAQVDFFALDLPMTNGHISKRAGACKLSLPETAVGWHPQCGNCAAYIPTLASWTWRRRRGFRFPNGPPHSRRGWMLTSQPAGRIFTDDDGRVVEIRLEGRCAGDRAHSRQARHACWNLHRIGRRERRTSGGVGSCCTTERVRGRKAAYLNGLCGDRQLDGCTREQRSRAKRRNALWYVGLVRPVVPDALDKAPARSQDWPKG